MTLLRLTERGLYCEAGDFFVDPWGPVDRAVVTHAHGDHIAWGCRSYLTSDEGLGVLRSRLAPEAQVTGLPVRAIHLAQRRHPLAASRRTHPGLGPGAHRACGRGLGRLRRLQDRCPIPPRRRSSRCAATPSSPSRPSAFPSIAGRRRTTSSATSTRGGAPTRSPERRVCSTATRWARRSGCWRASTRPSDPSTPTGPSSG